MTRSDRGSIRLDVLKQLVWLDPETGKLYWKYRPLEYCKGAGAHKRWNQQYQGREAFNTVLADGSLRGSLFGRFYPASRIAFALAHDRWPVGNVAHRNGSPADNRPGNLIDSGMVKDAVNQLHEPPGPASGDGVSTARRSEYS